MIVKDIREHGTTNKTYSGEMDSSKVIVIFEDRCKPILGDIEVTLGKVVIKNGMNYLYIRSYKLW